MARGSHKIVEDIKALMLEEINEPLWKKIQVDEPTYKDKKTYIATIWNIFLRIVNLCYVYFPANPKWL